METLTNHFAERRRWFITTAGLILSLRQGRLLAMDRPCALCQSQGRCRQVCRLVCEEKKVSITCWGIKEEPFCVPGPSCPAEQHCDVICDDNPKPAGPQSAPKKFLWTRWSPGAGGHVDNKKKLMKRTVTKTVPSFKWVIEDLCPRCIVGYQAPAVPADVELPPPPAAPQSMILPASATENEPISLRDQ